MGVGSDALPGMQDFELIASGPHSTVYRARQTLSGGISRTVAVKVLHGDHPDLMRRELEFTVRLGEHPNIITVYDIGVAADGSPYIVMEHCPLGSLAASRDARPVDEVLAVGVATADALAFAHGCDVIHRDIKPDNILVRRPEPRPSSYVLADFGIARPVAAVATASIYQSTYLYASPQHIQAQTPTFTDDVWSLGATLFTLLDGAPPFTNLDQHDNQAAYLVRVLEGSPRQIRRHDVPLALRDCIAQCLRKNPSARYTDAAQLRNALAAIRTDRAATPPPTTPIELSASVVPTTRAGESPESDEEPAAPSALAHIHPAADPTTGTTPPHVPSAPPSSGRTNSRRWLVATSAATALLILTTIGIFIAKHDGAPHAVAPVSTSSPTEQNHRQQVSASAPGAASSRSTPTATALRPALQASPTKGQQSPTPRIYPPEPHPNPSYYGPLASTYSGRCLGVAGGRLDDGAPVVQYQKSWDESCTRSDPILRWGWVGGYYGGSFKIVNQNSGKCLDISSDAAGADVVQRSCQESNGSQLWNWYSQGANNGWNQGLICNIRTSWCVFLCGQSQAEGGTVNQEPLEPYRSGHQFRVLAPHNPA